MPDTPAAAVDELGRFDPANLINVTALGGFCSSVQQACVSVTADVARIHHELAALRRDLASTATQLQHERRRRRHLTLHTLRTLASTAATRLLRTAYAALLAHARRARRRSRALRSLAHTSRQRTLQRCYAALAHNASAQRARADRTRAARQRAVSAVHSMASAAHAGLRAQYYARWCAARAQRRLQQRERALQTRRVAVLQGAAACGVLRRYFQRLAMRGVVGQRRRVNTDVANKLEALGTRIERDVGERFAAFERHTEAQCGGVQASCDALREEVAGAMRRHEMLGSQVDITLTSLSNTNGVLNKMVDRLLKVDEHLDVLHRDKISRHEVASHTLISSTTTPSSAALRTAAGTRPPPVLRTRPAPEAPVAAGGYGLPQGSRDRDRGLTHAPPAPAPVAHPLGAVDASRMPAARSASGDCPHAAAVPPPAPPPPECRSASNGPAADNPAPQIDPLAAVLASREHPMTATRELDRVLRQLDARQHAVRHERCAGSAGDGARIPGLGALG